MKVCLYGGAFDPVTNGHLEIATLASKYCDEVWAIPAYDHHFKSNMSDFGTRFKLSKIGFSSLPFVKVEALQDNGSTYRLMNVLYRRFPDIDFRFVIGQDNADTIQSWDHHMDLLKTTKFLVIHRVGMPKQENAWYLTEPHIYVQESGINSEVSSRLVRGLISTEPHKAADLVPTPVFEYIQANKLYTIRS